MIDATLTLKIREKQDYMKTASLLMKRKQKKCQCPEI